MKIEPGPLQKIQFVSLPMFAELTKEQIARVATELKAILAVLVS